MMGTIVNALAIVVGGLLGLAFKKGLPKSVEENIPNFVGTGVVIIGLNGILTSMLSVNPETGRISSSGELVLVLSLAVGGIVGELLRIDDRINAGGLAIERKFGAEGFAKGFVSGSMLFCIGAMAIVGALADGLSGDSSTLFVKAILDGITSIVFAATLGYGVLFSAIPILIYQGSISLCAGLLSGVLVGALLDQICMVGYCIVFLIGTNMLGTTKVKTSNLLPAMLGPVLYNLIVSAF